MPWRKLRDYLAISDSARYNLRSIIPIWAVVILAIVVVGFTSEPFRSSINVSNLLTVMAPLIIVSVGQALVILLEGIDLSVGSVMSLITVVAASYTTIGGNNTLNLAIILLISLGFGLANGVGVVLGINPLIMTLSTLAVAKGIALLILGSPGGTLSDQVNALIDLNWHSVPFFFVVALIVAFAVWYAVSVTPWGFRIYAVGASVTNAAKSGINWRWTTILTYTLSGLLAGLAGLAVLGRVYSGDPLVGDPYALDSITAVVLGGIALTGGRGSIAGAVAGAMLLALLDNLLNIYGVFSYYQFVVKGLILVAALVLYNVGGLNPARLAFIAPRYLSREKTP